MGHTAGAIWVPLTRYTPLGTQVGVDRHQATGRSKFSRENNKLVLDCYFRSKPKVTDYTKKNAYGAKVSGPGERNLLKAVVHS